MFWGLAYRCLHQVDSSHRAPLLMIEAVVGIILLVLGSRLK